MKVYSWHVRAPGFAIAVTVQSDILIVDEVIAVGTSSSSGSASITSICCGAKVPPWSLVSHGLELIETLCDEAVWMG